MDLINHALPNLWNGVSQQAATVRQPGQGQEQVNGLSSLVDGLGKRHGTNFIATLSNNYSANDFVHCIDRDADERYTVKINSAGQILVWHIDGTTRTVSAPNGVGYITSSDPINDLVAITVADYTIIVNKRKVVAMLAGSSATYATYETVQKFSDITYTEATGTYRDVVEGRMYTIKGDRNTNFGRYYVTSSGTANVVTECVVNGILNALDPATMPMVLIRNSDGSFTLKQNSWDLRDTGDLVTAANPSFVGKTINFLAYFRNRLCFLSGENIIFSRSGAPFNFWPESATQVLDSDPIDITVSNSKVATLLYAVPFAKNLVLFSKFSQFLLAATDSLTPKTVTINQATEFGCSTTCVPVPCGTNVYFTIPTKTSTSIREYFVQAMQTSFDAADITAHVPTYLPADICKLESSSNYDLIFAMQGSAGSRSNKIFVYKYYWDGDSKAQSSWSAWELNADSEIMDIKMFDEYLYIVYGSKSTGKLNSCKMDMQPTLIDFNNMHVHLDFRTELTGVFDAVTNRTTWALPYQQPVTAQVVLGAAFGANAGATLQTVTQDTATTVSAPGNYSASAAYVGIPYTFKYKFSPQYIKDANGLPYVNAHLKIKNFSLLYDKSSYFKVDVTPASRQTYTYTFTGKTTGSVGATLGAPQLQSGSFNFYVQTAADTVSIELSNDSCYPSFIQSAAYEGFLSMRSQRM